MAEEVLAYHGHVDILVNNAGRSIRRSVALSYDRFHDYERTIQLNYLGALRLILALLPTMRARKSGHIINISSIGTQTNPPRFSAYVASKAALDAFSRVIASEVVDDKVHITTINMPLVRTPMIAPTRMYDMFPAITPEEAAEMIAKAMVDKPKKVATRLGNFGELLYAVAPKVSDTILNTAYKLFPESQAAKGKGERGARQGALDRGGRLRASDERRALVSGRRVRCRAGQGTASRGPRRAGLRASFVLGLPRRVTRRRSRPMRSDVAVLEPCRGAAMLRERRLKHWGWGYEDQAPTARQLREAAEGIRARFGFGGEVEKPVPLEEVELRRPRLKAPDGLRRPLHRRPVRAGLARAGEGLPGRGARVSRGVREPAGPGRLPARRVGDRDGAELGRGRGRGGDPVRRRHQRRRRGRGAAGGAAGGDARPAAARPGARGRPGVAGGADPGRRHGAAAGGAAARARADPAPLPPVVRVLDARRLDRDPGRRPLRDALHPHRRPGRVGAGDHPARDLGEPAAAGLGRRPLARPAADRLRGDPRRDRRGLGAGAAAARVQGLVRGRVRRLHGGGAARCARSPSRASTPPTAACSTPPRRS